MSLDLKFEHVLNQCTTERVQISILHRHVLQLMGSFSPTERLGSKGVQNHLRLLPSIEEYLSIYKKTALKYLSVKSV